MSAPTKRRSFLAAPPPRPRLDDAEIARRYPRRRLNVFLGIFVGYAGFYLIRNNVSLVAPLLIEDKGLSTIGIGLIANAVLFAYGLSKFFMATLSDRSNARLFLPIGLALSALTNLFVAFVPWVSGTIAIFATVMFLNGWFQGMGWPASGRVLVHWFSTNERGWKTSIWNTAHNVGAAGLGVAAAAALAWTADDWRAAFWFPAVIALVVAVVAFVLIRDTPESEGLPPIEEHRDDPAKVEIEEDGDEQPSMWQFVRTHVLTNRVIVLLAVANVFVYALRYGVLNWITVYLADTRGAEISDGITGFVVFELAGIVGTLLCGWISDKVFRGYRAGTGMLFMALTAVALVAYWQVPTSAPLWISIALVAVIGGLIYGPVMLIGLQAIDLSPRQVAGTAAGFTGLFGYLLGATLASSGVGVMVHAFGWDVTFAVLTVCALLVVAIMWVIGKDEKKLMQDREQRRREKEAAASTASDA
ncbi:MFS transporter [Brachybacterium sp. sponge]|uniref:MFS transporter n=1 Tax=Brachybacterium sp. sponge TaxID=1775432 RepID=UPI0007A37EFB|nr:MFS transporter [Brachybacterium sp. sponge]